MNIDLSGKRVLVTGSSRGIGKAIAESFANAGAKVGIHYVKNTEAAKKVSEATPGSVALQADLSEPDQVLALFDNFLDYFNGIDILVNNAGIALKSSMDISDNEWLNDWIQTHAVNLNAVALLCKKAIQHFREHSGGIIINITSRAAFRGDTPEYMAYASSKGGVVALTRSIARAYGKEGVIAFNVAPGFTRTDMAGDFIEEYGENYALDDIALDRMTEPEDIAQFVTFLASGMANHATGSTIDINAGSYVH